MYVIHMPYIHSSAWPCNWLDHVLSMPQEWRWGTQCVSRYHLKPSTKAKQSLSCLSKKNVRQSSARVWCTIIPLFLDCINWKSNEHMTRPKVFHDFMYYVNWIQKCTVQRMFFMFQTCFHTIIYSSHTKSIGLQ